MIGLRTAMMPLKPIAQREVVSSRAPPSLSSIASSARARPKESKGKSQGLNRDQQGIQQSLTANRDFERRNMCRKLHETARYCNSARQSFTSPAPQLFHRSLAHLLDHKISQVPHSNLTREVCTYMNTWPYLA